MNSSDNSRSRRKTIFIPILVVALLVAGYAVKRILDKFEAPELLPGQQFVEGYKLREFKLADFDVRLYSPPEFVLETVNLKLGRPRMMFFHGDQLLIGSQKERIYRLDPPYDKPKEIAHLGGYPHSVLVRGDYLYIARSHGVFRAPYSSQTEWIEEEDLELVVPLEPSASHNSRTIGEGPDGRIYVSMGWPGNCSNFYVHESYAPENRRGGVFVIDESGEKPELVPFAAGLRNPVGFDFHPETGVMFATNNGPDHLGYDQPPEYFAKITEGSFHGMPWYQFNGEKMVVDECADFPAPRSIDEVQTPAAFFTAHSAPLGMVFVPKTANASEYYGDAIVALHGSWVKKDGSAHGEDSERRHPKLALVKFENGEPVEVRDLVSGFQQPDGSRWATPAGVAFGPDGDLYFTSDKEIQGLYRLRKINNDE